MTYDFDEILQRAGTGSVKYDLRTRIFGTEEVIPMWVADMDFRTPDFITRALRKRACDPVFGYTLRGDSFFTSVSGWMKRRHGWEIEKEWLTFSPGVVSALSLCVLAFTDPGDKVVIQPPVYHPFYFVVTDNDRKLTHNPLRVENGRFHMDFDHLESVIDERTKLLILSNPHNPGGTVWKEEELRRLGEICIKNKITLVSDEIHSDLPAKGFRHRPAASISREIAEITVTCMAPSKTFNSAGLAASVVIISNSRLMKSYRRTLNAIHLEFGNIFGNEALVAAYENGDLWLAELLEYLGKNIDYALRFFEERIPAIKVMKPEASYLLWLDCRGLMMDQKELTEFMIRRAKLGLNDGTMFGKEGKGFMRMNIGCPLSTLKQALVNLEKAVTP